MSDKIDNALIEEILKNPYTLKDLAEDSPVRLGKENQTDRILDDLFPANCLLCVGKTLRQFDTRIREEWRGKLADQQFIIPSPMSSVTGLTQQGKVSKRTLDNTGERRFLIIESDAPSLNHDEKIAILKHLSGFMPLAMVVTSGGKSFHGWFYCEGVLERIVERMMDYAERLGADRKMLTRAQFARLPDGLRDNRIRQSVCFYNPDCLKGKVSNGFRCDWVSEDQIPVVKGAYEIEQDYTDQSDLSEQSDQEDQPDQSEAINISLLLQSCEEFISLALPSQPHQNNAKVWVLARGVKGLESKQNRQLKDEELDAVFDEWYLRNQFLRKGQSKEEYHEEFLTAYGNANCGLDEDMAHVAFQRASENPLPPEAMRFESEEHRRLVALLRELQIIHKQEPLFLSCRTAAKLFEVAWKTANNWLRYLARPRFQILHLVQKGIGEKASRYYYLPLQKPPQKSPENKETANGKIYYLKSEKFNGETVPKAEPD